MARMTRDEMVQNPAYQNHSVGYQDNVSRQSWNGLDTERYRSMKHTEALIMQAVGKSRRAMTRSEICKKCDRAKSPRMIQIIESLVENGFLIRDQDIRANGVVIYYYMISELVFNHDD
jgi:hypothetical protein